MITNDEARLRVARGAAHLDQVKPGWFNRIDVGTLTLHDPCDCIVGQLCGGRFSLRSVKVPDTFAGGEYYGFSFLTTETDDEAAQWQPLQDAWIEAIADRRLCSQQAVGALVSVDAVAGT